MKKLLFLISIILTASFVNAESFVYLKSSNGVLVGKVSYEPSTLNSIKVNAFCVYKTISEGISCEYIDDKSPIANNPNAAVRNVNPNELGNTTSIWGAIGNVAGRLDGFIKSVTGQKPAPIPNVPIVNINVPVVQIPPTQNSGNSNLNTATTIQQPPAQINTQTIIKEVPVPSSSPNVVYQVIERAVPGPQGPAGPQGPQGPAGGSGYSAPQINYTPGAQYNGYVASTETGDIDVPNINVSNLATLNKLSGAGLSSCNLTLSKIVYNSTTKLFECSVDQGLSISGNVISSIIGDSNIIVAATSATATINLANNISLGSINATGTSYINTIYSTTTNASTTNALTGNIINLNTTNATITNSTSSKIATTDLNATGTITGQTLRTADTGSNGIFWTMFEDASNNFNLNYGGANFLNVDYLGAFNFSKVINALAGINTSTIVATGTSQFATILASTSYVTNLNATTATITNSTSTNLYSQNASLTNATVTNLTVQGTLTTASPATFNATSTFSTTTAASSTITSLNSSSIFAQLLSAVSAYITSLYGNSSNFIVSNASTTNASTSNFINSNVSNLLTTNNLTATGTVTLSGTSTIATSTQASSTITNLNSQQAFLNTATLTNATITNLNVSGTFTTASPASFTGTSTFSTTTAASSTITNLSANNAVINNSTSTNIFATNASLTNATSTNFFSALLNALTAVFTNLIATNATFTNSTSTNFSATNLTATNFVGTNATLTSLYTSGTVISALANGFTTRGSSGNLTEATSSLYIADNGRIGMGGAVAPTGNLQISQGTLTGLAQGLLVMDGAWNNAASIYKGIDLNITNTAAHTNSTLLNIALAGSSVFKVTAAGNTIITGNLGVTGTTTINGGLDVSSNKIINVAVPTNSTDAANKAYVDTFAQGITYQSPVLAISTTIIVSSTTGDRYIIGTGHLGTGCALNTIAQNTGIGTWSCTTPATGTTAFVDQGLDTNYNFNGSNWVSLGATVNHNETIGLQGGQSGEYYHLTNSQHSNLNSVNAQLNSLLTTGTATQFVNLTLTGGLNIAGSGATITNATFTNTVVTNNAIVTNLFSVTATASYATITNGTSTNWFATNSSSTNLFANIASIATGIFQTLFSPLAYITTLYATTTNATTSNITTANITSLNGTAATITSATATNLYVSGTFTTASPAVFTGTTTFSTTTAASSTIINLSSNNAWINDATITNSTSTNIYSANASVSTLRSNDLFAALFTALSSTFTSLFASTGNFTIIYASTTNATTTNTSGLTTTGNLLVTASSTLGSTTASNLTVNGNLAGNTINGNNASITNATFTTLFSPTASFTSFFAGLTNGYVWRGGSNNINEATSSMFISNAGYVGIGTTTPTRKLSLTDTVSAPQFIMAYDTTRYTTLQVDTAGDFLIAPSGSNARINDGNMFICSGGACPTGAPSGNGNLIVETKIGIGSSTPFSALSVSGGSIVSSEASLTDAGTITVSFNGGNQQKVVLGGNRTINFSNYIPGQLLRLVACQDATGSRTVTWDASVMWSGGTAPTLTTTANKCDVLSFFSTAATGTVKIFGSSVLNF